MNHIKKYKMEEFKLHLSPENYKKTIDSYDKKISKLKKEKGNAIAAYIGQNAFIPTNNKEMARIEVEREYIRPSDGKVVVEALHNMYLGYYAVNKECGPFFKGSVVVPVMYSPYGCLPNKSRQFRLNDYADRGTVEIRCRKIGSDTYYYSRGGNFEEMKLYDKDSKWHGGIDRNTEYVDMCVDMCGTVKQVRDTQDIEDFD